MIDIQPPPPPRSLPTTKRNNGLDFFKLVLPQNLFKKL